MSEKTYTNGRDAEIEKRLKESHDIRHAWRNDLQVVALEHAEAKPVIEQYMAQVGIDDLPEVTQ